MRARGLLAAAAFMLVSGTGNVYASTIIKGSISVLECTATNCAAYDVGGDAPTPFVGNKPTISSILSLSGGLPTAVKDIFTVSPAGSAGTSNHKVIGTLQVTFSFWEYNTVTHNRTGVTGSLVEDATYQANYNGSLPCSSSTGQSDCVYWNPLGVTLNPGDGSVYSTTGDKDNVSSAASVIDIVTMSNGDKFDVNFFDAQDWNITPAISFTPYNPNTPATPLPTTLPLFLSGLGGLGLLGWRRKRRTRAVS